MQFTMTVNMDNAAFHGQVPDELARLLHEAAQAIQAGDGGPRKVRDINGNTVGEWSISDGPNEDGESSDE